MGEMPVDVDGRVGARNLQSANTSGVMQRPSSLDPTPSPPSFGGSLCFLGFCQRMKIEDLRDCYFYNNLSPRIKGENFGFFFFFWVYL